MAYEEAASHLRDAVRLVELTGDEEGRLPLLLEQADSHLRAGDLEQARECFVRAADQALAGGDVDSLARSALGRHEVGETTWSSHSDAIGLLESALSVRGQPEDATAARLLAALSRELAHGPGDLEGAGTLSDRAVAMARRLNDPATLAFVAMLLTATTLLAGLLPARRAARIDPIRVLRAE